MKRIESFKWVVLGLVIASAILPQSGNAQATSNGPKELALMDLRNQYAEKPVRLFKRKTDKVLSECLKLLENDGVFSDLRSEESTILAERMDQVDVSEKQKRVSELNGEAFDRLWVIAETFRGERVASPERIALRDRVYRGFIHYAAIEAGRANVSGGRFHISCFAIPLANINSYFCYFDDMERVENGSETNPLIVQANQALKAMGMQAWTQPYRNDETDDNIISVERFQKHVWWVGGNGVAYRQVLPAAIMMNSVPMMDVMEKVAKGALSMVSQTTYDDAFWTEGFTADGAGWGHGMQSLVWGYPVHGTSAALQMMTGMRGTPWAQKMDRFNVDALMAFLRGSSWYYSNGFAPPCLGRHSMIYEGFAPEKIPSAALAVTALEDWKDSFTESEQAELAQFVAEANGLSVRMDGQPEGHYQGSRYFYNNDDLVVKTDDFYWFINMASSRCDGVESAMGLAAEYNLYTCDGLTLFQRRGDEAVRALGGYNLTAFPGVTARQGEDKLLPVTNWRGYCSKYNFAGGATRGGKYACAGFHFEKMNASMKENVNDKTGRLDKNTVIYGVEARKGWFVFGDVLLALGAGIRNLDPDQEGDVWTTIDQTLWESELSSGDWKAGHDGQTRERIVKASGAKGGIPWVKQASGFVYGILPEQTPGEVELLAERRATKWDKLAAPNRKKKNKPETADILQLWINHGREVQSDTYGYIVYGGRSDPAELFSDGSPVVTLSNTVDLQAAASKDGSVIQAVFYNPESVLRANGRTISVSAPCVLLAEFEAGGVLHLTVTDAEMNVDLDEIVVTLDRKAIPVKLPIEPHRGKPAVTQVQ